ncbi:PadR family transcriptional regulator [Cyanobium sp. Morenito 9A2]|uniref:PadR family transcriptional regulator n=1 Tax=Cyanobium sp. Morenito 9A2 TaxID=2823718 RepID=UPI0020CFC042|nr:PadR family transcriptional regulator [Cyanobium sp. Morenito 9A2]
MACYWTASQQQIYRELGRIEQNGWACCQVVPQRGKPDRKVYAITEAGRQELRQWAAEPSLPTPIREDLLVKVLGGSSTESEQLLAEVQRHRAVHARQLASYQENEALVLSQAGLPLHAVPLSHPAPRHPVRAGMDPLVR